MGIESGRTGTNPRARRVPPEKERCDSPETSGNLGNSHLPILGGSEAPRSRCRVLSFRFRRAVDVWRRRKRCHVPHREAYALLDAARDDHRCGPAVAGPGDLSRSRSESRISLRSTRRTTTDDGILDGGVRSPQKRASIEVDDKPIDFECTAESGDGLSLVANFHETAPHQGTVVRGRLEVCPDPGSNGYLLLRVYPGVCIRDGEDPVVPPCRGRSSGSRANARERWDFEHTFRNATLRDASELEAIVVRAGASVHYALTLRQDAAAESKLWHHDVGSPADPSSDTRSGI
ncbi:unnamed protein product [Darwinula stevensoni]|uniref:Uncharacterized protein n=1 Tax=Darwinula stevensoni TaxID=69355 RepID=A0A7R9ABW0_9CRUS|nr:unnamed protein product [Darwinula stevensoni]CAG0899300.1 unnamed protein product [Darwinula stevensoni]